MIAVILAGGVGSRLKPYTMSIPKPLLPVGDVPIIEVLLTRLVKKGITEVFLCLGHMAPVFQSYLSDGAKFGLKINYVIEDKILGTAGSLRFLNTNEENIIVMNGDLLTNFDFEDFLNTHKKNGAEASIAITKRKVNIDYGVVETLDNDFLLGFKEKPVIEYFVSMGINILNMSALKLIPEDIKYDMPDLLSKSQR